MVWKPLPDDDLVVCDSCHSVYRAARAGKTCRNCGSRLPEASMHVDLNREARLVGTGTIFAPLLDASDKWAIKEQRLHYGGSTPVAERMAGPATCGWCGQHHDARPDDANCPNCGGMLPAPPGTELGAPPPAPPRKLPLKFFIRLYIRQNLAGWLGVVCIAVSLLFMIIMKPFPVVVLGGLAFGLYCAYSGFMQALRRHAGLSRGIAVPGRIATVDRIGERKVRGYGSDVYRVLLRFDVNETAYKGFKCTYDAQMTRHFIGEPVWVVCLPQRPGCFDLWPPLA